MPNRCRVPLDLPTFTKSHGGDHFTELSSRAPLRTSLVILTDSWSTIRPAPIVLVADLAVAHRPLGQADVEPAGVNQCRRILGHDAIGHRMFRQVNSVRRVTTWIRVLSPTVADNDDNRTLGYCGGHVENPLLKDGRIIAVRNRSCAGQRRARRTGRARSFAAKAQRGKRREEEKFSSTNGLAITHIQ